MATKIGNLGTDIIDTLRKALGPDKEYTIFEIRQALKNQGISFSLNDLGQAIIWFLQDEEHANVSNFSVQVNGSDISLNIKSIKT